MGSWFSQQQEDYTQNILVATLNYGGIINGPFEFFSENQKDQAQISNLFNKLMVLYQDLIGTIPKQKQDQQNKSKEFKWNIGTIDKNAQKTRYTPLYNKTAGIENNKLINEQQFKQKWQEYASKWKKEVQQNPKKKQEKESKGDPSQNDPIKRKQQQKNIQEQFQSQRKVMMGFDLIAYHAILKHLYPQLIQDTKPLKEQNISRLPIDKYKKFLQECFARDYLNQEKKISRLVKVLSTNFHAHLKENDSKKPGKKMIDVMFIQQASVKLINQIKELKDNQNRQIFHVQGQNQKTVVIIARKQTFKERIQKMSNQYIKNWSSVIPQTNILLCNNFLLIGLHLSSKSQKNLSQIQTLKKKLNQLNHLHNKLDIIAGGDINSYLDKEEIQYYKIYPANKKLLTTNKKRTYMQAQYKKANTKVSECKDHIITNGNMVKNSVITIDIEVANDNFLLPTSDHPFDHFMVVTLLKKRLKYQTNNLNGKKKQENYPL